MGDYMNTNQSEYYWQQMNQTPGVYEQDYSQFSNQQLEFNTTEDYGDQNFANYPTQMLIPDQYDNAPKGTDEFDEPPLLEELEIYPDRILEKVLAVLNPLRGHSLADDAEYLTKESDLAGPISFCLILAIGLFLAGKNAHFGYIYGVSMISSILMYCLLSLMASTNDTFTLSTVGSILGYCLIPIVGLSLLGVFYTLSGPIGLILAIITVIWSSISASRLFIAVSGG
ncbi:hypothetical protein NQ314_014317 [Rhamnusium bicolor]|uniref:Protein YIPF n=1 Tax=Rhamnusium bicolor TaxID=1586634 RepID=A0AAV8X2R2_9CUCU|nr:hypothetical protein NQ314_014317 [Rhamnusium bicolor]